MLSLAVILTCVVVSSGTFVVAYDQLQVPSSSRVPLWIMVPTDALTRTVS